MTVDLVALGAIALFAIWGAFTGFARQVGQAVAGVTAVFAAMPAGRFFAEPFASGLRTSLTVGTIAATIVAFVLIYLVVRAIVTSVIKRLLSREPEENRGADRALGFALSGTKAALLIWIAFSAATFLEGNLVLGGKKVIQTPRDSRALAFARDFNAIETLQFSGGKDLALAGKLASDPNAAAKLKDDPDYAALMKDPRFKNLVQSDAWKKALQTGDVRALMQNDKLVELVRDPRASRQLERLAERAE